MTNIDSRWTAVDGVRMHSRVAGAGPPVVLVHGLAVSSRYYVPTIKALAPNLSAAAVDLPGFGRSEPGPGPTSVPDLGDWLARWLRATGRSDAMLVGNSAGCEWIVDCVIRHPDITGPLVLVGPTIDPSLRTAGRTLRSWLRTSMSQDIAQAPLMALDVRDAGPRRIGLAFKALLEDPIEAKLPRIEQRVLVVRGAKDRLVGQRWAEQVSRLLPRGELVVIEGGRHLVHFTQPLRFAAEVNRFLGA